MGAWTVLSIREDHHLSLLSCELQRLNISVVALSEVLRSDSGEITVAGYADWSGRSDDYHAQGVAVTVSTMLTPTIIEVIPVNECIMRLRIRHSLGVISLVYRYAPTEASDLTEKEAFHAALESVVHCCPGEILFESWGRSMH